MGCIYGVREGRGMIWRCIQNVKKCGRRKGYSNNKINIFSFEIRSWRRLDSSRQGLTIFWYFVEQTPRSLQRLALSKLKFSYILVTVALLNNITLEIHCLGGRGQFTLPCYFYMRSIKKLNRHIFSEQAQKDGHCIS